MQLISKLRSKARLNAVLIHADGSQEDLGDLSLRNPWYIRLRDWLCFNGQIKLLFLIPLLFMCFKHPIFIVPCGLITNAGLNYLAQNFTGETDDVSLFKYHDSGTGTTAAAQTDSALQTQAGPTTRATATNTQTQSSSGTGSGTPAILSSVATINYSSTLAITEWGLFNQSSQGGTMWDHRVFSALNVVSGDSIQFTYNLSLPGGGS